MRNFRNFLILVLGTPTGIVLTITISVLISLLWFIYLPWKFYNFIFKRNNEMLWSFEEFIIACYGLAWICTLLPLTVLDDEIFD